MLLSFSTRFCTDELIFKDVLKIKNMEGTMKKFNNSKCKEGKQHKFIWH